MASVSTLSKKARAKKRREKIRAELEPVLLELKAAMIETNTKKSNLIRANGVPIGEKESLVVELFTSLTNLVRLFVASEGWWREAHPHWASLTGDAFAEFAIDLFSYIGRLSKLLLEFSHLPCLGPIFETWAGYGVDILAMLYERSYLTSPSQAASLVEVRSQALHLLYPIIVFHTRCDPVQSKDILGLMVAFMLASREGLTDPVTDEPTKEFLVTSAKWIDKCVSHHKIQSSISGDVARLDIGSKYQGHVLPFFSLRGTAREDVADRLNQLLTFHLLVNNQTQHEDGGTHPLYQEMFKVDVLGFYASLLNDSLPYLEVNYDARIGVLSEVLISSISFALLTTKPFLNGAIRQLEYVTPRVSPFLIERWCISILRAPSDIAPDPSTVAQTIEQAVQALTKLPSVDDAIVEHNLVLRQLDTVQRRMKQSSDVPDIIRDAWLTRSSPSDEDVCASHLCSSVDSNGLLRCVSCMSKYYCSRECQRSEWKWHKKHCRRDDREDEKADGGQ